MTGKKIITMGLALMTALAVLTFAVAGPGQGKKGANATPPEIERGMFVNIPYWNSPPWYPPEEETDTYRWAPSYHWANPSINVLVNPTVISANTDIQSDAFDAVVTAFAQWNGVGTTYSATVSRDDTAGPSLDTPDDVNTVSWGPIDGPGGIIAVTYYWYNVKTKELIDCDIILDKDEVWNANPADLPEFSEPSDPYPATGEFDVWNIVTHEAGHTLVLGDLPSPRDGALTMHAYSWPGDDLKRTLGAGDSLGIQAIYGAP
jgi:hypothetical protein